MRELLARLRAMLRRPKQMTESVLSLGNTRLDARKFQTWVDGKPLSLLPKELQLLEFFMRYPEQVFSQTALLNRVWPNDCEATNQAFRSALKRLRKKLEEAGSNCQITAIYGVGYKFEKADME